MNKFKKLQWYLYSFIAISIATFSCLFVPVPEVVEIDSNAKSYYTIGTTNIASTYLMKNIVYNGNTGEYAVLDDMHEGTVLFSDESTTISDLPYKFINAEVIQLPNSDKDIINNSLLTFSVTKKADIYILRDSAITVDPAWLTSENFSKTEDVVTSSAGVIYDVWKKQVSANASGTVITIGNNVDVASDATGKSNQVVFIKETDKVDNRIFFEFDFDNDVFSDVTDGFINNLNNDTLVAEIAPITDNNNITKTCLHITDTTTSNLLYWIKKYAPIEGDFIVEFSAYVPFTAGDTTTRNRFLRTFVSQNLPLNSSGTYEDTSKSGLLAETYLDRTTTFRATLKDSTNSDQILQNNLTTNYWHNYKYVFDSTNKTLTLYVDNEIGSGNNNGSTTTKLYRQTSTSTAKYIIFGSGKSHLSDYALDDIKIYPKMGIGAESITIDGNVIELFNNISSYLIVTSKAPDEVLYSINEVDNELFSYTIDSTTYEDKAIVTVVNNNMESYEFEVVFQDQSIFVGLDIRGNVNLVSQETIDQRDTVHFLDDSTTEAVYIEKSFPAINTAARISYDIKFSDNVNVNNALIRNYATSGQFVNNYDDSSKIVAQSYLNPIGLSNDIGFRLVNTSTTFDDTHIINKDEWYTVLYEVNIVDHIYSVYIEDSEGIVTTIREDFPLYGQDLTSIDNLVFGTDVAGTADFYVDNVEVEVMSGPALNGITIDGFTLTDFDRNNTIYNYYTDAVLKSNSQVLLDTNAFYLNTVSITPNVNNQILTINITNNINQIITYTVNYLNPVDRKITKSDLQTLYDNTNDDIIPNQSDYTAYTYNILVDAMTEANEVLLDNSSIMTDYAYAYYSIEKAISGLLGYTTYDETESIDLSQSNEATGNSAHTFDSICKYNNNGEITILNTPEHYDVSLISTINYSTNLINAFNFEKVLQNGSIVYKKNIESDTETTFESVPYKYMNAEYLVMKNLLYFQSSFKFTTNQEIHLLVFKDWDSGPFNKSITSGATTYQFVDTGEIATSSSGVIYRVYQTVNPVPIGTILEIDSDNIINNKVTNNNNIFGFIKASNANNTNFFHEDMDDYSSTNEFIKSWDSIIACREDHSSSAPGSYSSILSAGTENIVKIYSNGATEMPIITKQFATLYEKLEFNFTMALDDNDGALTVAKKTQNKWLRTWITFFETSNDIGISTAEPDKRKTLVELYVEDPRLAYNYNGGSDTPIFGGTTTVNEYYDYALTLDIPNRSFTINTYEEGTTTSICTSGDCTPGNDTNKFWTTNVHSANYAYFTGRGSSKSMHNIKEISVAPIKSNLYSDIYVDGVTIGNELYQDLTKAYIYKYNPNVSNNLTVSPVEPSTITLPVTSEHINYYPNGATNNNIEYATVNSTASSANLSRNYKLYFEADNNDKDLELINLLDEAYTYNKILYTPSTFNDLLTAINDAEASLSNHKLNQIGVQAYIDDLTLAINNLERLVDFDAHYDGYITPFVHYNTFDSTVVNITNNSSFTANYVLDTRASEDGYIYDGLTHVRYFESSAVLPQNTKITLVDRTTDTPGFYYYVVSAEDVTNEKTSYNIADFIRSGTTNDHFNKTGALYDPITRKIYGNFFIVVDFESTVTPLPAGEYSMSFNLDVIDSNSIRTHVSTSDVLYYAVYTERTTFDIFTTFDKEIYSPNASGDLTVEVSVNPIVVDSIPVIDTTLINNVSGLKFSLYENDGVTLIPFSKGTTLMDITNDATYYLDNDSAFRVSRDRTITSFTNHYTLTSIYGALQVGSYVVKTEFVGTYKGPNDSNVYATSTSSLEVRDDPACAIKAEIPSASAFVDRDISLNFDVSLTARCVDVAEDIYITVTLYKKTNDLLFNDFAYTKVDAYDYFEDIGHYIQYGDMVNTYYLYHHQFESDTTHNYYEEFVATLQSNIPRGTYKAVFDVRAGDIISSDFYTFYVK